MGLRRVLCYIWLDHGVVLLLTKRERKNRELELERAFWLLFGPSLLGNQIDLDENKRDIFAEKEWLCLRHLESRESEVLYCFVFHSTLKSPQSSRCYVSPSVGRSVHLLVGRKINWNLVYFCLVLFFNIVSFSIRYVSVKYYCIVVLQYCSTAPAQPCFSFQMH